MTDEEVQQLCKIPAMTRTFTLDEKVMVNHQVSLLGMTVEAGISGDVMRHLYEVILLCLFPVMTDCLWIWLMK